MPNTGTGTDSNSLFYLRPEVAALKSKLDQFVYAECIPAEQIYEQHMKQRHGTDRWTINAIPPCLDQLKIRAKQLGIFNLFIPQHLRHKIPKELYDRDTSSPSSVENHSHGVIPSISLSYREYGIICETLGKCPQIASEVCNCNAPDTGNMEVLLEFGTKEQQQQYLIPLLNGTIRSTFLMTEPDVASSDPTNLQTKLTKIAIRDKYNNNIVIRYEYILSGKKWWSTGAMDPRCKVALIVAKMDYSHPSLIGTEYGTNIHSSSSNRTSTDASTSTYKKHNAHTIVIVPLPHPNIIIQRPLDVFGYDDAPHGHAEIILNNVLITSSYESFIVDEGYGFYISQARLGPGRIHHCMRSIGIGMLFFFVTYCELI
jgi:acyl-CoA dehydrogenase